MLPQKLVRPVLNIFLFWLDMFLFLIVMMADGGKYATNDAEKDWTGHINFNSPIVKLILKLYTMIFWKINGIFKVWSMGCLKIYIKLKIYLCSVT